MVFPGVDILAMGRNKSRILAGQFGLTCFNLCCHKTCPIFKISCIGLLSRCLDIYQSTCLQSFFDSKGKLVSMTERGQRPKGSSEASLEEPVLNSVVERALADMPAEIREEIQKNCSQIFGACASGAVGVGRGLLQKHHWVLHPFCIASPMMVPTTATCLAVMEGIVGTLTANIQTAQLEGTAYDLKAMMQHLRKIRRQWKYLHNKQNMPFPPVHAATNNPKLVAMVMSLEDIEQAETDPDDAEDLQAWTFFCLGCSHSMAWFRPDTRQWHLCGTYPNHLTHQVLRPAMPLFALSLVCFFGING